MTDEEKLTSWIAIIEGLQRDIEKIQAIVDKLQRDVLGIGTMEERHR